MSHALQRSIHLRAHPTFLGKPRAISKKKFYNSYNTYCQNDGKLTYPRSPLPSLPTNNIRETFSHAPQPSRLLPATSYRSARALQLHLSTSSTISHSSQYSRIKLLQSPQQPSPSNPGPAAPDHRRSLQSTSSTSSKFASWGQRSKQRKSAVINSDPTAPRSRCRESQNGSQLDTSRTAGTTSTS